MAEALAVVGVVASIVQLVEFGTKICGRLNEFRDKVGDVPECYRQIHTQLPLLLDVLKDTQQTVDAGVISPNTEKALLPVIHGCKEQIEALDAIINKSLSSPSDSGWKKSKKALSSLAQESKVEKISSVLNSYVQTLTFYHAAARSTLDPLKDDKLFKIRSWLSAPDPSTNYQKGVKLRQANTGLWFLESEQYTRWRTSPSSLIWLNGIPGCGKSILSSTVIEDVLKHCSDDPGKAAAYYFFDFNDSEKQSPGLMVKSLATQLVQQSIRIPTKLDSLFASCNSGQRQPSTEALLDAVRQMCEELPATFIILDALDECTEREELMETIEVIAAWHLENLHLLVTSRAERDIKDTLEDLVQKNNIIPLQSTVVDKDIGKYVRNRISIDRKLKKWRSEETQKEIEAAIMKGAHGMFRWAVCQLDSLGDCNTRGMLRRSLAQLPPTLDETYERILRAIDDDHSTQALRLLTWITFSLRPLSVSEIAEVVAVDPESRPVLDKDEILQDPLDVFSICGSLLTVSLKSVNSDSDVDSDVSSNSDDSDHAIVPDEDEQEDFDTSRTIALAHYSVKEYLTSSRIGQGLARSYSLQEHSSNVFLANCCLGYLLQFGEPDPFFPDTVATPKLIRYSTDFWGGHVRSFNAREESTQRLIMEHWPSREEALDNWSRVHGISRDASTFRPALFYASNMGLTESVRDLIKDGADPNASAGSDRRPLHAASHQGFEAIVMLLLAAGAEVDVFDHVDESPLQLASYKGHGAVVKLLLDTGANVNLRGGRMCNSLQAASLGGHVSVAKQLLDAGADVNMRGGSYCSALQAASGWGYETVVKLLLDAGADVNMRGGIFNTALQAASVGNHKAVVKLLLDAGADVNTQVEDSYSVLQAECSGCALHTACTRGNEEIVELLLDSGAEVNAAGGISILDGLRYKLALRDCKSAFAPVNASRVKLLRDALAEMEAQGKNYRATPLKVASDLGHEGIVKLLQDAGGVLEVPTRTSDPICGNEADSQPQESSVDRTTGIPSKET